ncbi:MAG TPA: c-type cytochrome [Candidatus Limnocylindria bacterium]|nr:c-type cytochrome [Candidatus Limnocylindria bacterium]
MRLIRISFFFAVLSLRHLHAADIDEQQRINTAIEALTRMENVNLDQKPMVKAAVHRVLEKTRGTPNFVKLVQHFKLTNQNAGLLEVAINNPQDESGVAAMRLVLASKDSSSVISALQTTNVANAVRLIEALGNAKEKQVVPWLAPLIINDNRNIEVRRAAVRALAQTQDGATSLLTMAKEDKLPENLKFSAATELNSARWPEIETETAKILPLPAGQNSQPLPPVSELVKLKGDAAKGADVFRRETTGCIKCHQVRGEGRELGPALSEIGTKLPKEALYEAILDPNAGISFGFEAWQVQLKSGDEAYGLKASETADEVAIKDTNGIVTRYKRSEIASMQQSKTSIMPSGLQMTVTTQELADLVEYLSSLRKTSGQ